MHAQTADGIVLRDTIFYPRGGGQPGDTGMLRTSTNTDIPIHNTTKKDGIITHHTSKEIPVGTEVEVILDWERRYNLMRMHTAAHIISAILSTQAGAKVTGNQLAEDESRIDCNLNELDPEVMQRYEKLVNAEIQQNHEITTQTLPRKKALSILEEITSLAMGLPEHITQVRLVRIGDFDVQACGGTHVANSKEVGRIRFTRTKNKGKNNKRIYFSLSQ